MESTTSLSRNVAQAFFSLARAYQQLDAIGLTSQGALVKK